MNKGAWTWFKMSLSTEHPRGILGYPHLILQSINSERAVSRVSPTGFCCIVDHLDLKPPRSHYLFGLFLKGLCTHGMIVGLGHHSRPLGRGVLCNEGWLGLISFVQTFPLWSNHLRSMDFCHLCVYLHCLHTQVGDGSWRFSWELHP